MTTQSLPHLRRIQVLLNTLMGERHVRRSLLGEVCDLMDDGEQTLSDAHSAAVDLLAELEANAELDDFDDAIRRITTFLERGLASAEADVSGPAAIGV